MFRKIFASILTASMLLMLIPMSAFAADVQVDFIGSVTLDVPGSAVSTFTPASGQVLNVAVTPSTLNSPNTITNGYVKVLKGAVVVKTLSTWSIPSAVPNLSGLSWDGKAIDATNEAQTICGTAGAYCPAGAYSVQVDMRTAPSASGVQFHTIDKSFTLVQPPVVNITELAVSKAIFNPLADTNESITFKTSAYGYLTVDILDGGNATVSLLDNIAKNSGPQTVLWNGKNKDGNFLTNNKYTVRVISREASNGSVIDTETLDFNYNIPQTITLNKFEVKTTKGGATFDPSSKGGNETLTINYTLNKAVNDIKVEIKDANKNAVKSFTDTNDDEDSFIWDGKFGLDYVNPGSYTVTITASLPGESPVTDSKPLVVAYNSPSVVRLDSLSAAPSSFDPNYDDAILSFINSADGKITVEVQNTDGSLIVDFTGYKGDVYNAGTTHNVAWNGKNTQSVYVASGTYKFVVKATNDYGVTLEVKTITVTSTGGSVSDNNAHVKNISVKPSSKFEPGKDDGLIIKFDIVVPLDSLVGTATRGAQKIEFVNEVEPAKESNYEVTWDGTDDGGEYVDEGTWKILLKTVKDGKELLAAKSINIAYNKPSIDAMFLSKTQFDNDAGEFTNVLFKLKDDANITLEVLDNGNIGDTITEDMEVDKNVWYAVEWDGGNYDYPDKLSIKLTAKNKNNDKIYTYRVVSVDLAEDTVSSNRANITNDYIAPSVTGGGEEMFLYFNTNETADITATIHKGSTASGTKVAELLNIKDLPSGAHALKWNGLDKDNRTLPKGEYTYKIVSKLKSTDSETGTFIVGTVGDAGSSASVPTSNTNKTSGTISPNVTFLTGNEPKVDEPKVDEPKVDEPKVETAYCGDFTDISEKSPYCEAVAWTKDAKIFQGYFDGTFKPYQPINRAEALKVILEGLGLSGVPTQSNLGFTDVQVNAWYMPYINNAKLLGVFHGDAGRSTARPEGTVNRVEALKFIFEALRVTNGLNTTFCQSSYGDVDLASWYVPYACASMQYQLFDGFMLNPAQPSTRGELAEILFKLHEAEVI